MSTPSVSIMKDVRTVKNVDVIKHFNVVNNRGGTLVEMLFASFLGALVLSAVIAVFIANTSAVQREVRKLLLKNTLFETVRFVQDDVKRAGYNGANNKPLLLAFNKAVHIFDQGLSYIYRDERSYVLTSFKADLESRKLTYCTKKYALSSESKVKVEDCPRYYSIFDSNQIELIDFVVMEQEAGKRIDTPIISISITIGFVGYAEQLSLTTYVASRYL